jgi:hypothetical protein
MDPDPDPTSDRLWIRILPSLSKNNKKNLDFYCFVTSFRLFMFENYVKYIQKVICRKTFLTKFVFVGILKVNDENRRIRIRIRIHLSEPWICESESGSTPKCHGTATLAIEGILRISFLCVHLIMMEKLAQAIEYKAAVYAPAEMADTLTLFHLYPYVLCG